MYTCTPDALFKQTIFKTVVVYLNSLFITSRADTIVWPWKRKSLFIKLSSFWMQIRFHWQVTLFLFIRHFIGVTQLHQPSDSGKRSLKRRLRHKLKRRWVVKMKDDNSNREVNVGASSPSEVRKGLLTATQSCSCQPVSASSLIIQTSVGLSIVLNMPLMYICSSRSCPPPPYFSCFTDLSEPLRDFMFTEFHLQSGSFSLPRLESAAQPRLPVMLSLARTDRARGCC